VVPWNHRREEKLIRSGGPYPVDRILALVYDRRDKEEVRLRSRRPVLDGELVGVTSTRLLCFKLKGVRCRACGIEGTRFYKERTHPQTQNPHLNLYAVREDGTEVLMTRDHVVPRSRGGPDRMENLQTMCQPCNVAKGDS
jgi:5-methylcytosine-specific restriction endonuclease McrA